MDREYAVRVGATAVRINFAVEVLPRSVEVAVASSSALGRELSVDSGEEGASVSAAEC